MNGPTPKKIKLDNSKRQEAIRTYNLQQVLQQLRTSLLPRTRHGINNKNTAKITNIGTFSPTTPGLSIIRTGWSITTLEQARKLDHTYNTNTYIQSITSGQITLYPHTIINQQALRHPIDSGYTTEKYREHEQCKYHNTQHTRAQHLNRRLSINGESQKNNDHGFEDYPMGRKGKKPLKGRPKSKHTALHNTTIHTQDIPSQCPSPTHDTSLTLTQDTNQTRTTKRN
ncbi:hypothetical protein CHS0354_009227 [Potamilus streckersoni]|uniref:Uncharacterized protein n=1 Tax=Potamilus streckersoni TaxID=2493646 RepID=A0AAE0VQI6_9BIVA|nr:hypothetical protein CHS0354_009227 [Potamilus streckersoni]